MTQIPNTPSEQAKLYEDSHSASDVDVEQSSIHHTIGAGLTQVAAGNHKHDDLETRIQALEARPVNPPPTEPGEPAPTVIEVPVGSIMIWPGPVEPTNFLVCDGTSFNRDTYPGLAAVLGDKYGLHVGTSYFLPNLKGRVPVGLDVAQTEFTTLGKTGGAKTHQLTAAQIPSHTHGFSIKAWETTSTFGSDGKWRVADIQNEVGAEGTNRSVATNAAGSSGAHNNLQPYISLNYIIKAQ